MSSPISSGPQFKEQLTVSTLVERTQRLHPPLCFKDTSRSAGFGSTLICKPGWVHLLQTADRACWAKFRESLLSAEPGATVQARLGTLAISDSHVRMARVDMDRWSGCCPWEVLVANGAPEWLIAPLFMQLGLQDKARMPCSALTSSECQRLAVASALVAREPVVYFEGLFDALSDEWREPVAILLTDCARQSQRIFVILDSKPLSSQWEAPRIVEWFDLDAADPVNSSVAAAEKGISQAMWSLERLMRSGQASEYDGTDFLITRPIAIHETSPHFGAEEDLAVECIANPEAAWEGIVRKESTVRKNRRRQRKDSSSWKRNSRLTKVSWWERLSCVPWLRQQKRILANWFWVSVLGETPVSSVPANARILHTQKWEWVWEVFVTPIVIILLVFAVAQLL